MAAMDWQSHTAAQSRLHDYLDDKLQTFADIDTLSSLLDAIKIQEQQLQEQLDTASQELQTADDTAAAQKTALQHKTTSYQAQTTDIDRRLRIVTSSETSDDALRQFDASIDQLHRLDTATRYLDLISQVEKLSKAILSSVTGDPDQALISYTHLRQLALSLKPLQDAAEGAAPHIVDHVDQTAKDLYQILKDSLAADLDALLSKILWPKPDVAIPPTLLGQWSTACKRLLTLQQPDLDAAASQTSSGSNKQPEVLLPLEIMINPLAKRFHYHFNGDKPTNRLDKPEYFLSHTLDLLTTYSTFISEYLQPVLFEHFGAFDTSVYLPYIDATSALVTAILPLPRAKIFSLVPQLLSQPNLLSHLVHELMGFDTTVRDEWHYTGPGGGVLAPDQWKGLTWEVLIHGDYFARWLQAEKDFALARYDAIVNDQETATLDYDSLERSATKPTKAAIRVKDLLETITERYRPLSSFGQKLQFLIDIQISILDRFHARLNSGLEAYLTMTSSIGRTVQGGSATDLAELQGEKGLDRLCRIFGSSEYLEKAMRDWSDDVFFLDLWNELQDRANARSAQAAQAAEGSSTKATRDATLVAGQMSIAEVASRTSSTLAESSQDDLDDRFATGALFDETAGAYARLRNRAEEVVTDVLKSSVRENLRPYARNNPWSSLASPASGGDDGPQSTSPDLNQVLRTLSTDMGFLSRAMGTLPLRRVARQVVKSMDTYVFDRVVMGNTFSMQGARQVTVDIETLAATVDQFAGGGVGVRGMRKSLEARVLLLLPSNKASTSDEVDQAEGDESARDMDDTPAETVEEPNDTMDLWKAQERLFESNQGARDVLEELGLEVLTENEAREVVRRRVELES